jgi:hypothetical protein
MQWQIEQGKNIPVGYYGEYMGPTVDYSGSAEGKWIKLKLNVNKFSFNFR